MSCRCGRRAESRPRSAERVSCPVWKTSPSSVKVPLARSPVTRTRRSARASTAGMGGGSGRLTGCSARSSSRSYCSSDNVTVPGPPCGGATGRGACACAGRAAPRTQARLTTMCEGFMAVSSRLVAALALVVQRELRGARFRRQFRREEEHGAEIGERHLHRQDAGHRAAARRPADTVSTSAFMAAAASSLSASDGAAGALTVMTSIAASLSVSVGENGSEYGSTRNALRRRRSHAEPRRVVELDAGARHGKVERRKRDVFRALLRPRDCRHDVHHLDDERAAGLRANAPSRAESAARLRSIGLDAPDGRRPMPARAWRLAEGRR